jgi:hypothetical protein
VGQDRIKSKNKKGIEESFGDSKVGGQMIYVFDIIRGFTKNGGIVFFWSEH